MPFSGAVDGCLTISIDLELLWGVWDRPRAVDDALVGRRERDICRRLLELFERYQAPVTWAVVGRLLERVQADEEPAEGTGCWFASDIVQAIETSPVAHDIGGHGYAHRYFGSTSVEEAAEDLRNVRVALERRGHRMTSFVFPRNQVAHLELLAEAGVKVFRSTDAGLLGAVERRLPRMRAVANILEKALALPVPVVRPVRRESGLVELPSSLLLLGRGGLRRLVTPAAMRRKLREGLERAMRLESVFHLWFHPSNFYVDAETQYELLEELLAEAARLRACGVLGIRTMSDFAAGEDS